MSNTAALLQTLRALNSNDQIRALDYQFARFLGELEDEPLLVLSAALVSYELGKGNVCLNLDTLDKSKLFDLGNTESQELLGLLGDGVDDWQYALRGFFSISTAPESSAKPLVLNQGRLYLYRYWQYEEKVANLLKSSKSFGVNGSEARWVLDRLFQRDYEFLFKAIDASSNNEQLQQDLVKWLDIEDKSRIDWESVCEVLRRADSPLALGELDNLIPINACLNWQKVAAALAASQGFSIISGGPGTGKTTTVTRLLAMLVELGLAQGRVPEIRLVAPTGKASARLTESIGGALEKLNCEEQVRDLIPSQAGTIHRLLGVIPNQPGFRHNENNPLHLDVLVVDEASMVDLPLMCRLLSALPPEARVILLGDRDQLASVEAGSVLGDICSAADMGYSPTQVQQLEQLTGFNLNNYPKAKSHGIGDSFCLLRKSYRFDALSGIGQLASAVNQGEPKQALDAIQAGFKDIAQHPVGPAGYQALLKLCAQGYHPYLEALGAGIQTEEDKKQVLAAYNQFRLLCAVREGRFGVAGLNQAIRQTLAKQHRVPADGQWYQGRPVLITQNDHALGLYNGDIGITLADEDGQFRVIFELPDGTIKELLPSRLPEHETVFAMTVHKSQGSEFNHTVLVLPDTMSPVLTRELVYTGITRAKKKLELFATNSLLSAAIRNPTQRTSGLKNRLLNR